MVQASKVASRVRYTLSTTQSELAATPADEIQIINDAGQHLCAARPWSWQRRYGVALSLKKNQPFLVLPSDFGEIIALSAGAGITQSFSPTTIGEIAEARSSPLSVLTAFDFLYAVESVSPELLNLLGATESLEDTNFWNVANLSIVANTASAPNGSLTADTVSPSAPAARVFQDVPATTPLLDGRDYLFSIYLKAGTAVVVDLEVQQEGLSATPETSSIAPKTVGRTTWTAGVPVSSLNSSQGGGTHAVGVEAVSDGWYRAWAAITYDADAAKPRDEIRVALRLDGTVFAWGAQLERLDPASSSETLRPRPYAPNLAAVPDVAGEPVPRLALFPTPSSDQRAAAILHYRRRWRKVLDETEEIEIPSWLEPCYFQLVLMFARAWHEEDEGQLFERLEGFQGSVLWRAAVDVDERQQVAFGPMRGLAAGAGSAPEVYPGFRSGFSTIG